MMQVENQLPINVFCLPSFNYPDTSLNFTNKSIIIANEGSYLIGAKTRQQMFLRSYASDKAFWRSNVPSDTLQVFVIDEKVLKEKSWAQIVSNNLYLRRVLLTYDEFCNNGNVIIIRE